MSVIEGKLDNFDQLTKEGLALVDFNADWCGACQMLKPTVEELADDLKSAGSDTKVISVNIDDEEEIADRFGVEGIPCLVLLKNGEEINRSVGVVPKKKLEKMLKKGA